MQVGKDHGGSLIVHATASTRCVVGEHDVPDEPLYVEINEHPAPHLCCVAMDPTVLKGG